MLGGMGGQKAVDVISRIERQFYFMPVVVVEMGQDPIPRFGRQEARLEGDVTLAAMLSVQRVFDPAEMPAVATPVPFASVVVFELMLILELVFVFKLMLIFKFMLVFELIVIARMVTVASAIIAASSPSASVIVFGNSHGRADYQEQERDNSGVRHQPELCHKASLFGKTLLECDKNCLTMTLKDCGPLASGVYLHDCRAASQLPV
jgi:hypothetical protein